MGLKYMDVETAMEYVSDLDEKNYLFKDLQLAAELGKTLLERNKELETALKQHQNVIEDQTQEIEYLTKQTTALREVNDSRLKIYEQLEVSIQELEHTNQKLNVDNISDKKLIKSLTAQIESLDQRCEELQRSLDDMTVQQESARRRQRRSLTTPDTPVAPTSLPQAPSLPPVTSTVDEEEVLLLLQQVQELKTQRAREQRRITDLEDQMNQLIQENSSLEERLVVMHQKEEEMHSLQEEMSMLEEIRQGQLCRRCLRGQDSAGTMLVDEDDDVSIIDSLVDESQRKSVLMQLQESLGASCIGNNPYRDLVEKYEALLKVQRNPGVIHRPPQPVTTNNCLSLQEELSLSGEFRYFQKEECYSEEEITPKKVPVKTTPNNKAFSSTPTDFSEAETSSSGFSDETSNKGTQTDAHVPPGSFLCTISDGDDCRFSIYDDASPVESRFRKTPEYRQLFREIFAVLKRAAEAKDEGEKLPLLDDFTPVVEEAPKVPPVTPAKEEFPCHVRDPEEEMSQYTEDQSDIVSLDPPESVASSYASDLPCMSTPLATKSGETPLPCDESFIENSSEQGPSTMAEVKKKQTKDILEVLSSGVGHKKKSKKRSGGSNEPHDVLGIGARVIYSNKVTRRKKEVRVNENANKSANRQTWCVSGAELASRVQSEQNESHRNSTVWENHFTKAATQVATLKMLDKSYAEALLQSGRKKALTRANLHRN